MAAGAAAARDAAVEAKESAKVVTLAKVMGEDSAEEHLVETKGRPSSRKG